jgi:hypothetical protein
MYPYTIYHVFIDDALGSPIGAFRCTDPLPVPGLALEEHGEAPPVSSTAAAAMAGIARI